MSVQIRISCLEKEELQVPLNLLKPISKNTKIAKDKKGGFYHAYIEVQDAKTLVNTAI